MKRGLSLIIVLLILASLSACADGQNLPAAAAASATPVPTPEPTPVPDPITRTDIPAYFAPGLQQVGAQPTQAYHIGVIAGGAFSEDAMRAALDDICAAYASSFNIAVSIQKAVSEAAQVGAAQYLLGSGIDLLIISAYGDRTRVGALCDSQDIPYITMDCRAGTPGQGGYICSIERDDYLIGMLTGLSVADTLTEKYGEPRGNIGEIVGAVSDEASILRSAGLRRALSGYPGIQVVCSVTTEGDTAYHAATNVMRAYRAGELDGIVAQDDAMALEALQAAVNYERDELIGFIWSAGASKDGLTGVWYGQLAQTVEVTAQSGMMAFEYALQYLEGAGGGIPPVVCSMTRAFYAASQQQKNAIAEIIAQMDAQGSARCMDSAGDYALFFPTERLAEVYPKHYYEYADTAAFIAQFAPFTTEEAVYTPAAEG